MREIKGLRFEGTMVSLEDLRNAYLNGAPASEIKKSASVAEFILDTKVDKLVRYLEDPTNSLYHDPEMVIGVKDDVLLVCKEVALSYASWLCPIFSASVGRIMDINMLTLAITSIIDKDS